MKRIIFLLLLALASPASLVAQQTPLDACPMDASALRVAYKETLTVSSTALPFTVAVYNPGSGQKKAVCAVVSVNTTSIRWWADGSVPTAAAGFLTESVSSFTVGQNNLAQFLMIRATGSDSEVAIQYMTPNN